jgi:hypothetical protein
MEGTCVRQVLIAARTGVVATESVARHETVRDRRRVEDFSDPAFRSFAAVT